MLQAGKNRQEIRVSLTMLQIPADIEVLHEAVDAEECEVYFQLGYVPAREFCALAVFEIQIAEVDPEVSPFQSQNLVVGEEA